MGALVDIISDLISIIVDCSGEIISFISEYVSFTYDIIAENPLIGILLLLLLIKIVNNIKNLV